MEMSNAIMSYQTSAESAAAAPRKHMLWIDGVGSYLLCLGSRVTIGGPHSDGESADLTLLANLSRKHATFVRGHEGYLLQAHSPVRVSGRMVDERTHLNDGYEIELGDSVRLRFRLPSVLSATATLEFLSDHRPAQSVDAFVLMDETCLLGPGRENHIRCMDWSEPVLLYRNGTQFCCKSRSDMFVDGELSEAGHELHAGSTVTGLDLRFRFEPVN